MTNDPHEFELREADILRREQAAALLERFREPTDAEVKQALADRKEANDNGN